MLCGVLPTKSVSPEYQNTVAFSLSSFIAPIGKNGKTGFGRQNSIKEAVQNVFY